MAIRGADTITRFRFSARITSRSSPALPESMLKSVDGCFLSPRPESDCRASTEYSMENNPESAVTSYGAVVYCNWLSERDGLSRFTTPTPGRPTGRIGYHIHRSAVGTCGRLDGEKHWIYGFTSGSPRCGSGSVPL